MAGQTWLQLTNAVLARLRESSTATVATSTYSAMIGAFVNEAKREVEDAWDWTRLRSSVTITTVASVSTYQTTPALSKRARILNAYNTTYLSEMEQMSFTDMQRIIRLTTQQQGAPQYYNFNGATSVDANVDIWPVPNGVFVLRFNTVSPQDDFAADATQLIVPEWPVIMGAWAKAVSERGEDGGANSSEVDAMYRGALADAIQQDVGFAPDEIVWQVA